MWGDSIEADSARRFAKVERQEKPPAAYTKRRKASREDMAINGIYYWASEATAEVDFVFSSSVDIFPIEVKASESLQAKSLRVYRDKFNPRLAIRTSLSNLRLDDGLLNVPLYALFNLENYLFWLKKNETLMK